MHNIKSRLHQCFTNIKSIDHTITDDVLPPETWLAFLGKVKGVLHVEDERKESVKHCTFCNADYHSVIRNGRHVVNVHLQVMFVEAISVN